MAVSREAEPQRRWLADAALLARLWRSQIEPAGGCAGDQPRYLSKESDRCAIIEGLRLPRRMFAAPAIKQFVRENTPPGAQIQTDDELLDYARAQRRHLLSRRLQRLLDYTSLIVNIRNGNYMGIYGHAIGR